MLSCVCDRTAKYNLWELGWMWNGSSSLLSGQSSRRGQPVRKYMTAKTHFALAQQAVSQCQIVSDPVFLPKMCLIQTSHGRRFCKNENFTYAHAVRCSSHECVAEFPAAGGATQLG